MYLKIVCLNELNRNYFYLLPLRLLLLPLNKNCFSNIVGFCVYIINTIIHGCLEIWNFSSRVQFDISLVRYAHSWDIALNTRREIPYLRAPMYYCLFIQLSWYGKLATVEKLKADVSSVNQKQKSFNLNTGSGSGARLSNKAGPEVLCNLNTPQ